MPDTRADVILCPVDFSGISANALRYASQLARYRRSVLVAAHANWFEFPPYFTESRIEALKKQQRDSLAEAERSLAAFVKDTLQEAGSEVVVRVADGAPAEVIARLASELSATLIVLGTHGRSGIDRWMLGSVAERMIRESDIPVITVRSAPRDRIEHIMAPVTASAASKRAAGIAADIASACDATLTVLHVQEAHGDNSIPNLCEWIPADTRSRCTIRELVRHGDPAREIVAMASELACDLLVVAAPARKFFEGMVLSRTTLRVVRHAPCPVLSVRTPAELRTE